MPKGAKRRSLEAWLVNDLPSRFDGRVLQINAAVAAAWGKYMALQRRLGQAPDATDAAIAALADQNQLSLATRNVRDFEGLGLKMFDPWA